jgi:hypothetical protein
MNKTDPRKNYQKPEVRRIKLSLAELTLGSDCNNFNPTVSGTTACANQAGAQCNV